MSLPGRARVLVNADVRVLDREGTRAEALAWRDGMLLGAGRREEVEALAGAGADISDVGGATVLPGFIDAHHHPCIVALYGGRTELVPPKVTNIESLQRALASAAAELPEERWVVATGWDELSLVERRPPTLRELDDAVPDHPVLALHYSCHRAAVNSMALSRAGIERHTPDPSGGVISRGTGGLPDGLLIERGISRVEALARASLIATDSETFFARLAQHHCGLAAAGITRIVDATVPADLGALYRQAAERQLLLVPTVMMPVSVKGYFETPWDALEGPVTGEREGLLEVGPLKLVFDGAPGCAMCLSWWQVAAVLVGSLALSARERSLDPVRTVLSTRPRVGMALRTGIQIYGREEASAIVRAAVERGFAVATHAIGNTAVETALGAYEEAGKGLGRAGMPRIEHALFLNRELVSRIAASGVSVVVQPHLASLPALASAPRIPGLPYMPLRWLLDAGARVVGSSDYPVADFAPLAAIRSATSRADEDQRIELEEALAMYTRTAAEALGCLDRCGTLEAGKRADCVVLDGPLRSASDLGARQVRATFVGGELAFGQPSSRRFPRP